MKSVRVFLVAILGLLLCAPVFSSEKFEELVIKAKAGDAKAQITLGSMYYNGEGVPQDLAEAAKWFRKSAEQGDEDAQFALGWMYVEGNGVPQDYAEAVKWFRKAAEQGNADAKEWLKKNAKEKGE